MSTPSPFAAGGLVPGSAATLQQQADQAARIAKDLATQAAAARRAELEASRPQQPNLADYPHPVVYFTRYRSGREYSYAAIGWREGNSVRWAITGNDTRRYNWSGLLNFIGEANWASIIHMTGGVPILPPGAEPPVAERMGRYGRVEGTETVTDTSQAQQGW